jgi:hypothetical protein
MVWNSTLGRNEPQTERIEQRDAGRLYHMYAVRDGDVEWFPLASHRRGCVDRLSETVSGDGFLKTLTDPQDQSGGITGLTKQ